MGQPWERLTDESTKAFEAFVIYRDMGPDRSLARVAQELGKSKTLIERWSTRDAWVRRVQLWDEEQDRLHRQYLVAHRRETDRRQLRIANAMQAKLVERLGTLDVARMSPRDLGYWLEVTAKVQRDALGLADKLELSGPDGGPIPVGQLSPAEQQQRMRDLAEELQRRAEAEALEATMLGAAQAVRR
jgi:hypothetical protein